MKKYFLKEYGSWGVMTLSYLAGIAYARSFSTETALLYIAASLAINAKQAFTLWMRKAGNGFSYHRGVFLLQIFASAIMFFLALGEDITKFIPYTVVPVVYLLLLKFIGEHSIFTEVSGFLLLTMISFMAKFTATGDIDQSLFIVVAVFFTAGVFKVRIYLMKSSFYRVMMLGYLAAACAVYVLIKVPLVLLLPMVDNLFFALTLYNIRLSTTGWLEVVKGGVFLVLLYFSYPVS